MRYISLCKNRVNNERREEKGMENNSKSVKAGDYIYFASGRWCVLDVEDELALCVSKKTIGPFPFSEKGNNYLESKLKKYIDLYAERLLILADEEEKKHKNAPKNSSDCLFLYGKKRFKTFSMNLANPKKRNKEENSGKNETTILMPLRISDCRKYSKIYCDFLEEGKSYWIADTDDKSDFPWSLTKEKYSRNYDNIFVLESDVTDEYPVHTIAIIDISEEED